MIVCDVCKDNEATHKVRPFGNPDYALLNQCDKCRDDNVLYLPAYFP